MADRQVRRTSGRPSMADLWFSTDHLLDADERGKRYRELLIEHDYAERTDEPVDNTLPCGWDCQPTGDAS